jgi:integrase
MAFPRDEFTKSGEPRFALYYRDSEGKQRKETYKDPKDRDRALMLKQADELRGDPGPSREKFAETLESFMTIATTRSKPLTEKVEKHYRDMADRLLLPYLGRMAIGDILRPVVGKWITWATGQSEAGSVHKAFTILSSVMGYAVDLNLIPSNPCSRMGKYLPPIKAKRIRPHLIPKQVVQLTQAVDPSFRAMILSMAVLGLRPGEAIALRVKDLDLDAGVLHVRRSATDVGSKMVERPMTKTGREGTIPLMGTKKAFEDHLASRYHTKFWVPAMGPKRLPDPDDILFTSRFSRDRTGFIHTAALAKLVRRAGERIGVKGLSADDLRHSASANAIEASKDLAFAQFILRHTAETMTLKHYDQGTPKRWADAIEAVTASYGSLTGN